MTREDREKAIEILRADSIASYSVEDILSARDMAIKALEQEPKEITLDEVKEYCKKRCLTLVTNQLFHELTHHQGPILDKIRAEIVEMRSKQNCSCTDCLDIIDKYKAEQEET